MQSDSFFYSLKVWLTSVVLAPVFYLVIESCTKTSNYFTLGDYMNEQITSYTICVFFGGIFSALTWVLFYLSTKVILLFYSSDHIRYLFVVLGLALAAGQKRLRAEQVIRRAIRDKPGGRVQLAAGNLVADHQG